MDIIMKKNKKKDTREDCQCHQETDHNTHAKHRKETITVDDPRSGGTVEVIAGAEGERQSKNI
jgi:hypothetical protein